MPRLVTALSLFLALTPRLLGEAPPRNHDVTVDDYYNLGQLMSEIANCRGYPTALIDTEAFIAELRRLCRQPDPMYPLLEFVVRSYKKLLKMEHKRYDSSTYRRVRAEALPAYREPTLPETAESLVEFLVNEKLIGPAITQPAP